MQTEDIADHFAIHNVLFRYAHALDDRDSPLLRTCFTEDAVCEVGTTLTGIDSIVAFAEGVLSGFDVTQHLIANPRCMIDGDRAESVCDLQGPSTLAGAPRRANATSSAVATRTHSSERPRVGVSPIDVCGSLGRRAIPYP
jgi:hypothetical protein